MISLVIGLSVFLASCANKTKNANAEKDNYEKAKESLQEREKKNPASFITVTSTDKHNLFGQTVVKGSVKNEAKICIYKDLQLELYFYSKTGTLLGKDNETIYEEIAPGKSVDFKTKYFAPKGTDSVGVKVLSAKSN